MYFDHIYSTLLPLSLPSSIPSSSSHSSTPSKLHVLSSHFKWLIGSNLWSPYTYGVGDMHWNIWSAYQGPDSYKAKGFSPSQKSSVVSSISAVNGGSWTLSFHARLITDLILCTGIPRMWVQCASFSDLMPFQKPWPQTAIQSQFPRHSEDWACVSLWGEVTFSFILLF